MPTARQETEQSAERRNKPVNALALLRKDHKLVSGLFEEFEKKASRGDNAKMKEIAEKVCAELTVHATVEEEREEDTLDEAEVEHASAKQLISEIQGGAGEDLFQARVTVLGEYIRHQVREEHALFAKIQKSRKVDLEDLGARIAERKK